MTILEAGFGHGAALAVVHNQYKWTFIAVARIRFPGIGLVDSTRRDLRVARWGGLLSSLRSSARPVKVPLRRTEDP